MVRSKVCRLAFDALTRHSAPAGAPALLLAQRVEADQQWRSAAYGYLGHALCEVAACGGRVLKGLAIQEYYPEPEMRHIGNVDAQFPTWSTAIDAVRRLRRSGWTWSTEEMARLSLDTNGVRYARLPLVPADAAAPAVRLDIHVGPYPAERPGGVLPLVGWRRSEALGVPVDVPEVESAILLIAVCAADEGFVSMKTVNDLHVIVRSGAVDWTSVRELGRSSGSAGWLRRCLAELAATYPGDPVPAELTSRRRPRERPERPPGSAAHRRAARRSGERRLITAEVWRQLTASARPGATRVLDVAEGLQVVVGGDGAALRAGEDIFVVTTDGRAHPDGVATAWKLLREG